MGIPENLVAVREKINNSAIKAGRKPEEIKLIAVSKTVELNRIIEAVKAGVTIFGENRVQEAQKKISDFGFRISDFKVEWHLIGSLQKNKAKYAVQLFDLIHTIDSTGLAEEVNKQAEKIGKIQRVLVQLKLAPVCRANGTGREEETKHGISEEELMPLLERIKDMKNLKLEGLMTMPPFFEAPEKTRPYFKRLRDIRDNINASRLPARQAGITHYALRDLSMGMSNDFEIAIEEGATMVRIGTAIFGERR